jgi:1,4-alpha-glucan branching enzyme
MNNMRARPQLHNAGTFNQEIIMPIPNDGMGSLLYSDGRCRFRVWAPFANNVSVYGEFNGWNAATAFEMEREGNNWAVVVPGVTLGQMYKYIITNVGGAGNDNSHPWIQADARALQVENSNSASNSYVVAIRSNPGNSYATPGFEDFLLYQLHVGSFCGRNDGVAVVNRTATFNQVCDKLQYIKNLGFNGIALLPIGDMYSDVNNQAVGRGYDGTSDMFAPEDAYASSKERAVSEFANLIDRAHDTGLAVIVDVVYNHCAFNDNRYWQYDGNYDGGGEYLKNGHIAGPYVGFAMWQQEVKDFFLDNARMFLRDYQVDGIRFDATQYIQPDALEYIAWGLRRDFPNKYLIAEYNPDDPLSAAGPLDPYNTLGFHATWDMSGPSQMMDNVLNGNAPVDNLWKIIGDFQNPCPWCSVRYLAGSHDQIGTEYGRRYIVDRYGGRTNGWALAKARMASALNVAIPGTPMLFMGTEGAQDGAWDPGDQYGDRRVDWSRIGDPTGAPMQRLVMAINNLRWQHPALRSPAGNGVHSDYTGQVVAFKRYSNDGDLLLIVANASDNQWAFHDYGVNLGGESGSWMEIFNSQSPDFGGVGTTGNYNEALSSNSGYLHINLSSWSVVIFKKL